MPCRRVYRSGNRNADSVRNFWRDGNERKQRKNKLRRWGRILIVFAILALVICIVKAKAGGTDADQGFEGHYYDAGEREKAVITFSGSEGGSSASDTMAWYYKQHGISSLGVTLFAGKETGKNLDRVPLEYVENIHGPVLLISTEADTVWPSAEQAAYIERYLSVHDFSYEVKNLTYKNVSHFTIPMRRNTWLLKLMFRSERQSPEECAAERADLSEQAVDFIQNHWK